MEKNRGIIRVNDIEDFFKNNLANRISSKGVNVIVERLVESQKVMVVSR